MSFSVERSIGGTWRRGYAALGLLMVALFVGGCAALMKQPEPPQVTLAGLNLTDVSLFEQRFRVQLRLQNPNDYDLPLDGFQFDLKLNDQPFLSGVSSDSVTLPRLGSTTVEMDAVSKLSGLMQQIQGITLGQTRAMRYSLTGKIHLVRPLLSLPVKEEGELDMSWLGGR